MRALLLALIVVEGFMFSGSFVPTAEARTTMTRTEIRATPIHSRPYRAGHFYGNTVRRRGR
ncbi:MAG TPA: hypothetical protein VL096_04205 [Pirellulaceae bacterium]|nr:hypothetical protein [Pirellulaceae bacterium]